MEKWNLGAKHMEKVNPDLIYSSISGFGQTGPYSSRPGFASACEAMGGFRYVNGFPDRPSVRPNLSMGDTLAGFNAALGTVLALYARDGGRDAAKAGVRGQVVDTAIYEAVFGIMEGALCDYSGAGIVREPSGSTLTGIVPSNTYKTKDGKGIVIGANSNQLFKRLMTMIGRSDMANDAKYADNQGRVQHQTYIDSVIEKWTVTLTADEVKKAVDECGVPNGLIYSIKDICEDEQYRARGQLEKVYIPQLKRDLLIPAIGPKLDRTPGETKFPGHTIGQDTYMVLKELLQFSKTEIDRLKSEKIVA
jgi:crotonobetainyl-CoA:carnitine CoA-transferase CaiB-like acyl-CoA transferase